MSELHNKLQMGVSRPVVVLLIGHLLSAALWFHAAGRLGIPALGLPTLFFAWPVAVSGLLLLQLRLAAGRRDGPGPGSPGENAGLVGKVARRVIALLPHAILAATAALLVLGLIAHFRDYGALAADEDSLRLAMVMAAVAAFRQEFGTRWMWISVLGQFAIAWVGAFVVYQGGKLIGLG